MGFKKFELVLDNVSQFFLFCVALRTNSLRGCSMLDFRLFISGSADACIFISRGQHCTPAGWVILKTKQALGISQRL